jgi:predicted small metal-binding protein
MQRVMSKRLDCPMEGCHASIEGETEEEIMAQAEAHAASAHPDLTLDEETAASIRSKIVDT